MITKSDISIVLQGPVDSIETKKSIESIRRYLKGATIILSTWEGANVEGLDFDVLIENKDPGSYMYCKKDKIYTNINRQLVSIKAGLEKVQTKYAFKLRSDLILTSDNFLKYFDKYEDKDPKYKFFKKSVLVSSLTSKEYSDGVGNRPVPFHVSDWFYFGLTEDLNLFFSNIENIADEEAFSNYKLKYPEKNPVMGFEQQYASEQYACYKAFSKKFDIKFEDWSDWNDENILQAEVLLANNFVFLDPVQHGLYIAKFQELINNNYGPTCLFEGYINHYKFLTYYKKHANKKFIIPLKYRWKKDLKLEKYIKNLNKHWGRFINSLKGIFSPFVEFISIILYLLKIVFNSIIYGYKLLK